MISDNLFNYNKQNNRNILSLSDVLHSLERCVRDEFPNSFWLKAEVSKINLYQYSGHAYPELVEKKDNQITAQTKAIIWKSDFERINAKLMGIVHEPLKDGISIVCFARLTFHPLYGLSLIISDIDPSMTLGQLEKERLECIQRLKTENVFSLNSTKRLVLLPQRLAIISVSTSKGYSDFMQTIGQQKDKYAFFTHLFPSLLQGDNAAIQMIEALNVIRGVKDYFDCVLIIRGGGGDIGLSCYNDYELCKQIATFELPVLTGVGHSTNETVAEMVSYRNFITPTALAEFILNRFETFDQSLKDAQQSIVKYSYLRLKEEYKSLSYSKNMLLLNVKGLLKDNRTELENNEKYLKAINPLNLLNKGYSITLCDNSIIKSIKQLEKGKQIETILADGRFVSIIE